MFHLLYSSHRAEYCCDDEINKILATCQRNNAFKEVTGVLLHSDNFFVQYLEGQESIMGLFEKIKIDPRHESVTLLSNGAIANRTFPNWTMAYKSLDKLQVEFLTSASHEEVQHFYKVVRGEVKMNSNIPLKLLKNLFSRI